MASMLLFFALAMASLTFPSSSALPTSQPKLRSSAISAAPALLPNPPTLSPDITPLLPSPRGSSLSPAKSSVPTIPSSPSPPNPDATQLAPGLGTEGTAAFAPSGSLPTSSSLALHLSKPLSSATFLCLLAFWLMQLSGQ